MRDLWAQHRMRTKRFVAALAVTLALGTGYSGSSSKVGPHDFNALEGGPPGSAPREAMEGGHAPERHTTAGTTATFQTRCLEKRLPFGVRI